MKNNIITFTNGKIFRKQVNLMCTILKKIRNKSPNELFVQYDVDTKPPINISVLLEKIGISTIAKDFTDIEKNDDKEIGSILGAAVSSDENLAIFYKKSDTLHRKKFTIAHELGHCCYDCPNYEASHVEYRLEPYCNISLEELNKERRANIFAGELLVPKQPLIEIYDKMLIPSLTDLAEIFDVSTSVMAARLDYLRMPYFKDSVTEIIL